MFGNLSDRKINKFYNDIVEDGCIFDNYDKKWVNKLIDKWQILTQTKKQTKERIYY